ncbi:MAG: carboxypeptidase-like regulatory domain-containing protein [Alphaproteobacteria bacterium]|nr:carboxypeptidase-like regulatory domain-containing protein [Alphaproteobacteria bacterium]
MRTFVIIIMLYVTTVSYSQSTIDGWVRDHQTNESLLYCSVSVRGSTKGTITNGEGTFTISVNPKKDTLLFSYVGYEPQAIPASLLLTNPVVLMNRKNILLGEVVIHSKDDYIFDILERCRKSLLKDQTRRTAKVFYGIETQAREQPVEQLECYYNAYLTGNRIDQLRFKNGRMGLAVLDDRYFLTLNTSAAISRLNLTTRNENYPLNPLQLTKRELKKYYRVEIAPGDDKMYTIKFRPRKKDISCFWGMYGSIMKASHLSKLT